MALRIIYGKSGSGKSEYCFKEIAKLIEQEKKIYIITPEQFSFTAERKLMEAIDTKAVINAEVITLSRMAYRVLQEVGGARNTKLTKCGKAMLVYSILNDSKKELKFLNKSDENIDISINAITEFKKHGITVKNLQDEAEKMQDEYLKAKLKDMILIYEKFEKKMKKNYIEENDLLNFLAETIEETDFAKDSIIYIDEFAGFTYQEYQVIKKLIKIAKQVSITICTDSIEESLKSETDIFYTNKKTVAKIMNLAKEENLKVEKSICLEETPRFKTEELKHIERNIYKNKVEKYEKEPKNINLFLAKNQYSEVEKIAKEIIKLVRDKKLRYRDISIITRNLDTYSNLVRAIFAQYEIPVFIDEKRELTQNIIVQYLLSIFEIFSKNFSRDAVFNYLKTGFSEIEKEDIFKLENYCIKWGIKNNKWKNDFKYGINEKNKEELEYLNKLREEIVTPLVNLKKQFGNVKETTNAIYNFLQEQKIEQKIYEKIQDLENKGLIDLQNEYRSTYQTILNIFDEIVLIFGNENISIDKYVQILRTGLKNSELSKIPGTQDQVIVGDVERSRTHKVDVVFIIGLNDGSFPSVNKIEGFFGDKDREILKQDGIELANGTLENLYEENYNIYKVFTTAEKQIYLSYASSDDEGKALRQSILINKIKRIFPKIKENSDIIEKDYEVIGKEITYQELLENIAEIKNQGQLSEVWKYIYQYYKKQNKWKERLQNDLEGLKFTNLPKDIDREVIRKLYGDTLKTSVSKLEKYSMCPFSYYLQYGLRLKEKEELKVQSFDTGSFMHETIDEFFKMIQKEKIQLTELLENETKIEKLVDKIIEEKLENGKNYAFVATTKYKVLIKRLKRIVSKALKYIIEGLVYSEFEIQETELEFSSKGKYRPIVMKLEDGKTIEITGKIDRIDTAVSEEGKYLRIIDYKSSAKDIDLNEVYAGIQIQLLTYMDAVCREEDLMPAGILYFGLLEQMIKADKKMEEEKVEEEIRKNFKMKGLILADIKVIRMHDKNLQTGTSKLVPAVINKGDIIGEKTNGVDKAEFQVLQNYIYRTIKQIAKEILSGKINLKPYNKNGKKPCEYCSYKAICGFDTRICGNNYNFIDKKSKDDIIRKMKQLGQS